ANSATASSLTVELPSTPARPPPGAEEVGRPRCDLNHARLSPGAYSSARGGAVAGRRTNLALLALLILAFVTGVASWLVGSALVRWMVIAYALLGLGALVSALVHRCVS